MRTRLAAAAGLWALCVGAVALVAWLAIDTAGRQVPAQALSSGGPVGGGSVSADRSGPEVTVPGPADRSGRPAVPRAGDDAAAVYSVAAGSVSTRCAGSAISLDGGYARPDTGWAVEVLAGGPERVQVVFNDTRRAVEILGRCADGRPRYAERTVDLTSPSSEPAARQPDDPDWHGWHDQPDEHWQDGGDHHPDQPYRAPQPEPSPTGTRSPSVTPSPSPTPTLQPGGRGTPQRFSGRPTPTHTAPNAVLEPSNS